ncbi:MAG: hypothetical protein KF802_03050 [Bdellovibrionaceae bacterium]|nr:hypothetical protein [Pseudobdellovibrionaceae bacterium]MBX3033851.1 hypothetical protein [Pseudobdellovibrionaceae bacterium]
MMNILKHPLALAAFFMMSGLMGGVIGGLIVARTGLTSAPAPMPEAPPPPLPRAVVSSRLQVLRVCQADVRRLGCLRKKSESVEPCLRENENSLQAACRAALLKARDQENKPGG